MAVDDYIAVDAAADDGLHALLEDGARLPVKRAGQVVRDYGDGWRPSFIYAGFGSILLLELRHEDGREGTWFLDTELNILPSGFDQLEISYKQTLQISSIAKIDSILSFVLSDTSGVAPESRSLLHINRGTLEQILKAHVFSQPSATQYLLLDRLASGCIRLQRRNSGMRVRVSADIMRHMMGQRIVDLVARTIEAGQIAFPSPVDEHPVLTDTCICMSTFVIMYKCYDRTNDLMFHVITSTHVCRVVAVYFPGTDECFCVNKNEETALRDQLPYNSLDKAFRDHLIRYGSALVTYMTKKTRDISCLAWHRHLGHHLWQDMTGIEKVERDVGAERMPRYIMVSAARSEMFGPIDILFPSLTGRVDRSCNDVADLIRKVYGEGVCLLSPSDSLIRRSLASRVIDHATNSPELEDDRNILVFYKSLDIPIILLGLRVENRTVVDFPAFCEFLANMIIDETGGSAVIIIDGHNNNGTTTFESASDQNATKTPIEVEHEIAARLIRIFSKADVHVIDNIGSSMARSVFWSHHADFFITPWGAGLAKYIWIANKPGLVLAGHHYQREGFDLHIYDSPEYIENSMPMTVLDINDVEDAPDDQCLIMTDEPQRTNFKVRLEAVRGEVRRLLLNSGHLQEGRDATASPTGSAAIG